MVKIMIKKTHSSSSKSSTPQNDPFISCNDGIEKCCIAFAYMYLQWLFHSGEQAVAKGILFKYLAYFQYENKR